MQEIQKKFFFTTVLLAIPVPFVLITAELVLRASEFGYVTTPLVQKEIDFSIARNLEWILNQVDQVQPAVVINLAYTACNSHVAREVVRQSEPYNLDGIIVLVGNNEVIGPFGREQP